MERRLALRHKETPDAAGLQWVDFVAGLVTLEMLLS